MKELRRALERRRETPDEFFIVPVFYKMTWEECRAKLRKLLPESPGASVGTLESCMKTLKEISTFTGLRPDQVSKARPVWFPDPRGNTSSSHFF